MQGFFGTISSLLDINSVSHDLVCQKITLRVGNTIRLHRYNCSETTRWNFEELSISREVWKTQASEGDTKEGKT